jgi:glycerate 2-kinase
VKGSTARRGVLVCCDKFRGSMTATQACCYLSYGLRSAGDPGPIVCLPVADGGEGTIDCFAAAGFAVSAAPVAGPAGSPVVARFATRGDVAVIESAQAVGIDPDGASPDMATRATSRGVGELITYALDLGFRDIVVGVGATATTDAGAGLLQALGVRLLDNHERPIPDGGAGLHQLHRVDMSRLDDRLKHCRLTVATDVTNPLIGPTGCARVFSPQKGAGKAEVALLDSAIEHFVRILTPLVGARAAEELGAGAGGGIGYPLLGMCGATRVSGADAVLDLLDFDDHAKQSGLIITGEGSLDASSLSGKAPTAVAARSAALGLPTVAAVGRCTLPETTWRKAGFADVYELASMVGSQQASFRRAAELLIDVGRRIGVRHKERS